jgi:hypothetical protein
MPVQTRSMRLKNTEPIKQVCDITKEPMLGRESLTIPPILENPDEHIITLNYNDVRKYLVGINPPKIAKKYPKIEPDRDISYEHNPIYCNYERGSYWEFKNDQWKLKTYDLKKSEFYNIDKEYIHNGRFRFIVGRHYYYWQVAPPGYYFHKLRKSERRVYVLRRLPNEFINKRPRINKYYRNDTNIDNDNDSDNDSLSIINNEYKDNNDLDDDVESDFDNDFDSDDDYVTVTQEDIDKDPEVYVKKLSKTQLCRYYAGINSQEIAKKYPKVHPETGVRINVCGRFWKLDKNGEWNDVYDGIEFINIDKEYIYEPNYLYQMFTSDCKGTYLAPPGYYWKHYHDGSEYYSYDTDIITKLPKKLKNLRPRINPDYVK